MLVKNTLKRIIAGLRKYVATGDGFLMKYYGNGDNVESLDQPCGVIRTKDCFTKVQSVWLDKGFSGPENHQSINTPAGALLTKDHYATISAHFLDKTYGSGDHNHQSINVSAGVIMTNNRYQKVTAKCGWLMNHTFNNPGSSVDDPAPTLLASRRHFYLNQSVFGDQMPDYLKIKSDDTPEMKEIKEFCHQYRIIDIRTRMLRVDELKKIQGFPDDYYLAGNQTDQKKFIGNSVCPQVAKALMEALAYKLEEEMRMAA